jgi:hypothetical protein
MEKFTWNDLAKAIEQMPEGFRANQVCIAIDDEDIFRRVAGLETMREDIYVNNDDDEDCGSLEELQAMNEEDFKLTDYRLTTPKGTPFLWAEDAECSHELPKLPSC